MPSLRGLRERVRLVLKLRCRPAEAAAASPGALIRMDEAAAGALAEAVSAIYAYPPGELAEDAADRLVRAVSAAFDAQASPDRPYRRPGSHLLLTDEWWALHDKLTAARERQRARYGDLPAQFSGYGPAFGGVGLPRGRMLLG